MDAGWKVQTADLEKRRVVFARGTESFPKSSVIEASLEQTRLHAPSLAEPTRSSQRVVLLLPCSGRKRSDGGNAFELGLESPLSLLTPPARRRLIDLRREVAAILGEQEDFDFDEVPGSASVQLLPAWKRYDGHLYQRISARTWERALTDRHPAVLIVSALYGLVGPTDLIRKYDARMDDAPSGRRLFQVWRGGGLPHLLSAVIKAGGYEVVHDLLSGPYRKAVGDYDNGFDGIEVVRHEYPGLGTGSDYHRGDDAAGLMSAPLLSKTKTKTDTSCARVHAALNELPLRHEPTLAVPKNGLYFFYEEGEICAHTGGRRVVRVGNHPRSVDGLLARLRMHYSGSKNSSVFRKFLGGALMRKSNPNHPCLSPGPGQGHWEKQDAKPCEVCKSVETEVSQLLRASFGFCCVEVVDRAQRNRLEVGLVAAMAECEECIPSPDWLGRFAYNRRVMEFGLWNSDFVEGSVPLAPEEVGLFEELARSTTRST